jgi:peptidoglycan/LPS O-acetylase OafA/YrhL
MSFTTEKKPAQAPATVLVSIQALRGIAVMAVVLIHIQLYFSNKLGMPGFLPQFNVGAASVDVFFVISGFIMVYASERLFGQPGGMRVYFLRRIARIVPMYWGALTILLAYVLIRYNGVTAAAGNAAGPAPSSANVDYVLASYFFWPYVHADGWGIPLLGVGWTLNYEVFFYALFGLLIGFSRRTVVLTIGALFCVLIAIRLSSPGLPNPFAWWFNPIIIEFVFGMGIAFAYREGVRLPMWLVWTLVAAGLAGLGYAWHQAFFFEPWSGWRVLYWGVPAILIVGSFALAEKRVPQNLFWRVTGFLGDASYSIYLVHTLTLGVPVLLLGRFIAPQSWPWFYLALMLLATTIPSFLVYLYIEKPLIDYFAHKIEGPRAPPQAAAVATSAP